MPFIEIDYPINKDFTIITPCSRPKNLLKMKESINFEKVNKWIIVYDTSNGRSYEYINFNNNKIIQVNCGRVGKSGNQQRNFALEMVSTGWIYFLDDDNIIHNNLYDIIDILSDENNIYTFDQQRNRYSILKGNRIEVNYIDTAMFIINKKIIKDIIWKINLYNADGYFICDLYKNNNYSSKYINKVACYYNFLTL